MIQSGSEAEQLVTSVISARAAIAKNSLERGRLTSDQFVAMTKAATRVYDSQVYSPDMPTANGTRVSELAAELCRGTELDELVIAEALNGGETFRQAARREVEEELGIPQACFGSGPETELPSVRIVIPLLFCRQTFLAPMPRSAPELRLSKELHECHWFAADALPKPLHYGTRRAVRRLRRQRHD